MWLRHEYIFLKRTTQNSIVDVNLLKFSFIGHGKSENNSDCGRFHNWRESFFKVKAKLLMIAFCYKDGFIIIHCVVWILFYFEDPFASNKFSLRWKSC